MVESFDTLLPRLRATAEPSRLRLLAILARGEFSVSELTGILGQSQPRVSRHLKLLDDAGLLERFREQHWICYRVAAPDQPGGRFVRELLERLDPDDPVLRRDEARMTAVIDERARAVLHSRGLSHCVLQQGGLRALPQPSASVDVAIVDRVLAADPRAPEALREAARVLHPDGRLLLVEDYEALADRAPDQNPLALLRGWIEQGGLVCARLHPVDVGRSHLLLAVATTERAAVAA